ncbi:MAG: glycosyl hydrolase family 28-related protein [Bacillus sp. (in: firmicutes)]
MKKISILLIFVSILFLSGCTETVIKTEKYSTPFINVKDYGAVGDGKHDDTKAIKKALEAGDDIYFPKGTYLISDSIVVESKKIHGAGMEDSVLYSTANAPILRIKASKNNISDLGFQYEGWDQRKYEKRNAIQFEDQIAHSVFENLNMVSVYRGFYIAPSKENYAFSVNIRNIYIFYYAKNAIHLVPPEGGNTGSVIENIYTSNGLRDQRYEPDVVPFVFERASEMTLIQLNAEWANIEKAFQFDYCFNVVIISPHLEGNNLQKKNSTLFDINHSNVKLIGGRAYDNETEANSSLFTLKWNSDVSVDTFYVEKTNEKKDSFDLLRTEHSEENELDLTGFKADNEKLLKNPNLLNEDGTPVLTRLNDQSYFDGMGVQSFTSLPGPSKAWRGKMILLKSESGDKVYFCKLNNGKYEWIEVFQ